ncbi:hypothetical protein PR001_g31178 [Phytophthora rubi]|uniref:Uncharacterized protein n=1 Tax=Phytophthora rubi TaxID=129364 RepID=A0A6A3GM29_9STRA|nr:hypothetical protein PR001_g31178 [Phytophthora rubi]
MKGQVEQRIAATTAETAMILLLDPRTKFSVNSLIQPSNRGSDEEGKDGRVAEDDEANDTTEWIVAADNEKVIYGAAIPMSTPEATPLSTLHHAVDKILQDWLQYMVDWIAVALHQTANKMMTKDDLTRLLLVRRGDVIFYRVDALCEYVNILRWFRESGSAQFPSIAALSRVWLGRAPSNAFQERVISTGGFVIITNPPAEKNSFKNFNIVVNREYEPREQHRTIGSNRTIGTIGTPLFATSTIVMSNLRTSTDNHRAEMQVVLKHNRKEIQRMEADSTGTFKF